MCLIRHYLRIYSSRRFFVGHDSFAVDPGGSTIWLFDPIDAALSEKTIISFQAICKWKDFSLCRVYGYWEYTVFST